MGAGMGNGLWGTRMKAGALEKSRVWRCMLVCQAQGRSVASKGLV